jgi:ribosomal protein L37AE/L43A
MSTPIHTDYDVLALQVMLGVRNPQKRAKKLAELNAHASHHYACPDCGHKGPHHRQGDEFACASCGMQHQVPEIEL